jgi:hypothetical protein
MIRTLTLTLLLCGPALADEPATSAGPQYPPAPGSKMAPVKPQEFILVQQPIQEVLQRAKSCLDDSFKVHEDRFWVILTNADYKSISHIGRDLKAARHQFIRLCQVLGSARPMPKYKMLCIVFTEQEDFIKFSSTCGISAGLSAGIHGYFSPADQWIVFYEPRGMPMLKEAREGLAKSEESLAEYETEEFDDPVVKAGQRKLAESWAKQIDLRHEALRDFEQELQTSITVHEAFHQLSWLSGFVDSRGGWTYWLHEGFATSFETDDTAYAFGPAQESLLRREAFKQMLADNELLPLRTLLTFRSFSELPPDRISVFYQQSYALVRWLYRFRRTQLNGYLRSLRMRKDLVFPRDDLKIFREHFGPIDRLERRWLRDEMDDWSLKQAKPSRP